MGEAVSQMDHVTQQNAALVEESAAAAESLKSQAQQLAQAVAVFKLWDGAASAIDSPTTPVRMAAKGLCGTNRAGDRGAPAIQRQY